MTSSVKGRFFQPFTRGGIRFSFLIAALFVALMTSSTSTASMLAGTLLLLLGVALQFRSKGCLHQNREVTQSGPYRFVRHPFYTSCLLIDAGVVVMTGWWPLMLIAAVWWPAVYIPAIRKEEAQLRRLFGREYDQFIARVPMLIPFRRPLPKKAHRIDWVGHNIMVTEMPRAIRHLTFPLLIWLASTLADQDPAIFMQPPYAAFWLLSAVCSLLLCSLIWRMAMKHGRRLVPMLVLHPENRVLYIALIVMTGLVWDLLDPSTDPLAFRIPGLGLLALSFLLVRSGGGSRYFAEAGLALGLAFLFEFEWFTLLLVPYYLALFIPVRLLKRVAHGEVSVQSLPASSFALLCGVGLTAVMLTEFWI